MHESSPFGRPDWRRAIVCPVTWPSASRRSAAAARWGRPLDLLAACGHGRSYGDNRAGRGLPSIPALWERLRERSSAPTAALLTDVGNDLLYQAPVATILAWVESCLRRLRECDARVIVTGLPLCNLANPSPRRFLFFRTLFFPGCSLPLEQLIDSARRLDDGLASLTERYQAVRVEPQAAWYGLDPIHLRYLQADHLWPEILASWTARETSTVDGQSPFLYDPAGGCLSHLNYSRGRTCGFRSGGSAEAFASGYINGRRFRRFNWAYYCPIVGSLNRRSVMPSTHRIQHPAAALYSVKCRRTVSSSARPLHNLQRVSASLRP